MVGWCEKLGRLMTHEIPPFPVVHSQHFLRWSDQRSQRPGHHGDRETQHLALLGGREKGDFARSKVAIFGEKKMVGDGETEKSCGFMSETSWFSKSFVGFSWGEVLKMLAMDWSTESVGWAHYEWKSDAIDGNTWEYTHQKMGMCGNKHGMQW